MKPPPNTPVAEKNNPEKTPVSKDFRTLYPETQILQSLCREVNKTFGLRSKNNQSSAACIVAAVYNKVLPATSWAKNDMQRILDIGYELYRTSVIHTPLKQWQTLKPPCVHPTFYVENFKATIFVGNSIITGEHTQENSKLPEVLAEQVPKLLAEHCAIIINNRDLNCAIWKADDYFYLFCPHGANDQGFATDVGKGKSFTLRTDNLDKLITHLISFVQGKFSIYSLRILKLTEMKTNMSGLIEQILNSEKADEANEVEAPPAKPRIQEVSNNLPLSKDLVETGKQFDLTTNSKYVQVGDGAGSLLYNSFEEDVGMIIFDNLAALITLHRKNCALWNTNTIAEILALGKDISTADFDVGAHIAGNLDVIAYNKCYRLEFEKVIFGQVTSADESIPTVMRSVEMFFKNYDVGLIDGPQNVAIWKERGIYFSFDAKERDALGRKWTRRLSKQLGPPGKGGGACVVWHKDFAGLAETYISNIPVKHRSDPFRIIYVNVTEPIQGNDWGEWRYIKPGQWILEGDESICRSLPQDEQDKTGRLLCIACCAIMTGDFVPENEWWAETLTNILHDGKAFYEDNKNSMVRGPAVVDDDLSIPKPFSLKPSDMKNTINLGDRKASLKIETCIRSGSKFPELRTEIEDFFQNYRSGIITFGETVLPIWTNGESYFLFDTSEKSNIGETLTKPSQHLGNITAVRFSSLNDMINAITANSKYLGCGEFCISRLETASVEESVVPRRHYITFVENGSHLFQAHYHEGHRIFGARADKQTIYNLLTALCFTLINDSVEWSKIDLVDILRIGDRMYAQIFEDCSGCESKNEETDWTKVQPEIGICHFQFDRKVRNGILSEPVKQENVTLTPEEEENRSAIAENSENDSSKTTDKILQDGEERETTESEDTLVIILNGEDSKPSFHIVLQCDFFTVAIWKQNRLYFIFDPKANNLVGFPTPRRIEQGLQSIQARKSTREENGEEATSIIKIESGETLGRPSNGAANTSTEEIKQPSKQSAEDVIQSASARETPIDPMSLANDGSAYVAWFQTLDDLINHIMSKVPPEHHDNPITVNILKINKTLLQTSSKYYKNFEERDADGFWIIRASTSQEDQIFPNRTLLDGSSSIIAFALTILTAADDWSSTVLDIVLKYGDRLYSKSLLQLEGSDKKAKLKISQLAKSFSIYHFKFDYNITENVNKLTLNNPEQFEEVNPLFSEIVNRLSTNEYTGLILNLNGDYLVALWKHGSNIFIFDSHGNDPNGKHLKNGKAALMRFSNVNILFKILRKKFDNIKEAIVCEINEIQMTSLVPAPVLRTDKTLANFHVPSPQSAFVPDDEHETRMLRVVVDYRSQHASELIVNLSALILSHLLHTECWTPTIMSKMFSLAENLQHNSNSIKILITPDRMEMDLKGLLRCFTVDDTICTLNLDEIIRGPIIAKNSADVTLENSLTLLLRNFCRAIIITSSFMCAIWREDNMYYLFNAPDGTRPIVLSSTNQDKIFDWMIQHKPNEEISNWYEIVRMEIASVRMKDVESPSGTTFFRQRANIKTAIKGKPKIMKHKRANTGASESSKFIEQIFGQSQQIEDLAKREKAACIVAAAMCYLKDISKWKKETFQTINRSALLLFMDSVAVQGSTSLEICNMEKFFQLKQVQMQVEALPPNKREANKQNILQLLAQIFHGYKTAYISTSVGNMLAVRWKDKFHVFHPEKTNESGQYICARVAHFGSFEKLVVHLLENTENHNEKVSVGAVNVLVLK